MNIKSIVILIVLALISAAIFFYIYNLPSEIESVAVTQDPSSMDEGARSFTDVSKEIFVLVKLSKFKKDENIKISWYKKTKDNLLLMQDTNVKTINDGSGYLKLSLVNKNGKYDSGNYLVDVYFNSRKEASLEFAVK